MNDVHLITLAPGHFHAALIQKQMLPGINRRVHVFAPFDADLLAHLQRVLGFNSRAENPANWEVEVHAGDDWLERFADEKPGNVAVLAGRNRLKIDRMLAAVDAGVHVLADKPWIINADDLPKLRQLLETAERSGLTVHDVMTERYEITSILQRELVRDRDVFGEVIPGSPDEPAVYMRSVHYLKKLVAGAPLQRPAWFFDVQEQGEALADVGTHLVDLVMWILFPDEQVHPEEVAVIASDRSPVELTAEQFSEVTGLDEFPPELRPHVKGGTFHYWCNNQITYAIRGIHVKLDVLWDYESESGGDLHHAEFRGTRSTVSVRQGPDTAGRPEVFIRPKTGGVDATLGKAIKRISKQYPGIAPVEAGDERRVEIPEEFRVGHEAHFAEVTAQFLRYLRGKESVPDWETTNLLSKYFTTTNGVGAPG